MKAYVFPGQGAQFVGMGKGLYESNALAKELFDKANDILGFRITDMMFSGTDEDLRQTKVTQPAIFLHSVILAKTLGDQFQPVLMPRHNNYPHRQCRIQSHGSFAAVPGRQAPESSLPAETLDS